MVGCVLSKCSLTKNIVQTIAANVVHSDKGSNSGAYKKIIFLLLFQWNIVFVRVCLRLTLKILL